MGVGVGVAGRVAGNAMSPTSMFCVLHLLVHNKFNSIPPKLPYVHCASNTLFSSASVTTVTEINKFTTRFPTVWTTSTQNAHVSSVSP